MSRARMIVQIYEVSTPDDARAMCRLGVDHIGVLVGDGTFPREQSIERARAIFAAVEAPSRVSALSLSRDVALIRGIVSALRPPILHLGASTDLLGPADVARLKHEFDDLLVMRSIPVTGRDSVSLAKAYDGIADFLLLDSHVAGDTQIGALGITHDWGVDRQIVEAVTIPVIIAGGLGPENVAEAIRAVHPAGVDSKTKTDKEDGSHTKDLARVKRFVEIAKAAA